MITAKKLILYTTLTLSTQQQRTLATAASLQNIERQTKVFIDPNSTQYNPPIDLTSYGYNYVHNSSDTSLLKWISWPPPTEGGIDTDIPGKVITLSNVNSIDECAAECQEQSAPSGSYDPSGSFCYCYFFDNPTETSTLCREPCLEYEYIDFSTDINFDNLDYCRASSCDWYYDIIPESGICTTAGGYIGKEACGAKIEGLLGSDAPTGSPSGSVRILLYSLCEVLKHMTCSSFFCVFLTNLLFYPISHTSLHPMILPQLQINHHPIQQ